MIKFLKAKASKNATGMTQSVISVFVIIRNTEN